MVILTPNATNAMISHLAAEGFLHPEGKERLGRKEK
jgi:hypothetical protein